MADDILTRAFKRAEEEMSRLKMVNAALHDEIERLRVVTGDLAAKINWMIDTAYAWDSDKCFTFPDGEVWRRDSHGDELA